MDESVSPQVPAVSQTASPPVGSSFSPASVPMPSAIPVVPTPAYGKMYFLMVLLFILGIGLGFALYTVVPKQAQKDLAIQSPVQAMTLPSDAVQIQACSDHRGTLYVRPQDIPVGPVYMVHNGAVIGIEYMLSREEFLTGKNYKYLEGRDATIDHVNIGLISEGHEGYTSSHYHVDLYTVPRSIADGIVCPKSPASDLMPASESAH